MSAEDTLVARNVGVWKIKNLINKLEQAKGHGTSMISLIIPPKDQISRVSKMLGAEFCNAANIKLRVNRVSVLSAITSLQHRIKKYEKVPTNGLIIYCSIVITDEGKYKKVTIFIEPFKPINNSLYLCDKKFNTEVLSALLADDDNFGFIVMDGKGALFGKLQGNCPEILHTISVDLPKKHSHSGQSARRFARIRMEKRHNYMHKVAETSAHVFINLDRVNITGLILAGSADFKSDLAQSGLFDPRLQAVIVEIVDVAYGGMNGFNQAINLAARSLQNIRFLQEKRLLSKYLHEVHQGSGKFCFGMDNTLHALELGAIQTVICWECLAVYRYVLKSHNGEKIILHVTQDQKNDKTRFTDKQNDSELELVKQELWLEWIANNYQSFGATLEIVSDHSQEGSQFVQAFKGVGGILRYKVEFQSNQAEEEVDIEYDLDDY